MVKKEDKTKPKNWIEGDTFAWKINREEYPEYNGRYLIFIRTIISHWNIRGYHTKTFRVKITKEKRIPSNKEEIEQLEYIQTLCNIYDEVNYEYPEILKNVEKDKYGLAYQYIYLLYLERKSDVSNLKYIGNYKIENPYNEYIPKDFYGVKCGYLEQTERQLLQCYDMYNLKKNWVFEEESVKQREKNFQEWIKEKEFLKKLGDAIDGPNGNEILKAMGIDIEKEKRRDRITHVGKKK